MSSRDGLDYEAIRAKANQDAALEVADERKRLDDLEAAIEATKQRIEQRVVEADPA